MDDHYFRISGSLDAFAKLPALAKRLGVEPTAESGGCYVRTRDGSKYDVFDLVNALLDRLDREAN